MGWERGKVNEDQMRHPRHKRWVDKDGDQGRKKWRRDRVVSTCVSFITVETLGASFIFLLLIDKSSKAFLSGCAPLKVLFYDLTCALIGRQLPTGQTFDQPSFPSLFFFNGGKNSYGRQRDESFQEGGKKKKMADTMCKTWLVANISAFGRTMLSPRIEITCGSLFSFHWTLRPLLFFKTIVNDRSNTVVPPIFPTRNSKLLNERIIFKLKKTQPRTKILKEKKMAFVYLPSGVGTRRRDSPFFLISTSAFVCGWSKDPSHTKSSRGRGFPVVVETPKLFFFFFLRIKRS